MRVYAEDGVLARTIVGHTGGVISLSISESGQLVSGSWDGTFRIWNLDSGEEIVCSDELENGISVACLPGGMIASGSTGRKEGGKHVGYHVRLHSADGKEIKKCQGHSQAVRGVVPMGGDGRFATVSNDGSLIVWGPGGDLEAQWRGSPSGSEPTFLFCAAYRPAVLPAQASASASGSASATSNYDAESNNRSASASGSADDAGELACPPLLFCGSDDGTVKVFAASNVAAGPVQALPLSGTPWSIDTLPNGDVVVGCMQAASSSKGHAYVFS